MHMLDFLSRVLTLVQGQAVAAYGHTFTASHLLGYHVQVDHDGHRQKSAKALGIGVRTLGLKLKKWKEQQLVAQTL